MTFKNAFKTLLTCYRLVWVILLYVCVVLVIVASLSVTFAVPIVRVFAELNAAETLSEAFAYIMEGNGLAASFEKLHETVEWFRALFVSEVRLRNLSVTLLFVVLIGAYRFLLGLYDLPLARVLRGAMSDNARYGFTASFIRQFGKTCVYSAFKMLILVAYDAVFIMLLFGVLRLLGSVAFLQPFAAITILFVLNAVRFALISGWAPAAVVADKGVFTAFGYSIKQGIRRFGQLFSLFLAVFILLFSVNVLIGVLTLGVGLVITIPLSMLFLGLLNMTFYYNDNKRRYYVEGKLFDPTGGA